MTLNEEETADEKLTALAKSGINEQAAAAAHGEDEEAAAVGARASGRGRQSSGRGRR
jgi:hypothetical protein